MTSRYISADKIHNGRKWLPAGTTLQVAENGTILDILTDPTPETLHFSGTLSPGFVNVHCHTELSHMKGLIPEHTGLVPFLKTIPRHRNDKTADEKLVARHAAYHEMVKNGIVALGDIANTVDSMDIRGNGDLHVHTFVEALGFTPVNAARSFGFALETYDAYADQVAPPDVLLRQTITPHAPYSVSEPLFRMIDEHNSAGPLSIHNQECADENAYYVSKSGRIGELLDVLGVNDQWFQPSGMSSIRTYLPWLSHGKPYIFVHNTFTGRQDIQFVQTTLREAFWCLCPNANLYIENSLPDVAMLMEEGATICLGTDSLASNHQLDIMAEVLTLHRNFPAIGWERLLTWATYNGAFALGMQHHLGTLDIGKKPGILSITGLEDGAPAVTRIV